MHDLFRAIHAALPQTQCTRCGYADCEAYALAIAAGKAAINQCPPGGAEGVDRLAHITGQPALPLSVAHGTEGPRKTVYIDEAWCIGCTLCIKACPTDAIVGSNKRMHTVMESCCTGCELCLPVCPVDCILTEAVDPKLTGWAAWSQAQADQALHRYAQHRMRIGQEQDQHQYPQQQAPGKLSHQRLDRHNDAAEREQKRRTIEAALAKARNKPTR
jgi:electron transport complex protein RnfB